MKTTWPIVLVIMLQGLVSGTTSWLHSEPPANRVLTYHRDNIYSIAASPDGRWLVSASEDMTVCVWDWPTGKVMVRLEHDGPVYEASFSPDGRWLATADGDGKVHLFDGRSLLRVRCLEGHTGPVYALAFSPDSRWLATGGGEKDHACRVWEVSTGKSVQTLLGHQDAIYGVAFGANGQLATASGDKTVRLWDWRHGKAQVLQGHTSYVYRCRFSPDARHLATASHDRTVRIWESGTGKLLRTLQISKQPVYAVAFSGDGKWLACAGEEHAVRIWDWQNDALLKLLTGPKDAVYAVGWLHLDGREYLVYGGGEMRIHAAPAVSATK
ncbi:MAG: WD40 repeat domain-containing protein [Gemmatales bacterium]|nr:WD40 repeat domain-containing protein [Gemmatales bacterium]MDW8175548.1 WD40 repeat domain-containing protein [Gemmatales bacterium]